MTIFFIFIILIYAAELVGLKKFFGSFPERSPVRSYTETAVIACVLLTQTVAICLLGNEISDFSVHPAQTVSVFFFIGGEALFSALVPFIASSRMKRNFLMGFVPLIPLSFMLYGLTEMLSLMSFDYASSECLILGIVLIFLFGSIVYLLTRRSGIAVPVFTWCIGALGIADHYYFLMRSNPLEYYDLTLAGTAMDVIGNYHFAIDHLAGASLLALFSVSLLSVLAFGVHPVPLNLKKFFVSFCAVVSAFMLSFHMVPDRFVRNLFYASREEGYIVHFLSLMKTSRISAPDGYSTEKAESILETFDPRGDFESDTDAGADPLSAPDIIVIMDESFADLPAIYGFETDTDLLPFIHSLYGNAVSGTLLTSVYGGGTEDTEYEFLTGNSLYFFPFGSSPLVQYVVSPTESLATHLKELGYDAFAYHPFAATNYRRDEAYPLLGFDYLYSAADDLPANGTLRAFVSDEADFRNLIYLYENRDRSRPFFMFNVTMQNHGGYEYGIEGDFPVLPVDEELQYPDLLEYLCLIHETDSAFKELIDYFSGVERDVIVLFFGDHQPGLADKLSVLSDDPDFLWYGDSRLKNYASFLIWANFDIETHSDVFTSPNYLSALLLKTADIETDAFRNFLCSAFSEMPAINVSGYFDAEGNWSERDPIDTPLLSDYRTLVYMRAFDPEHISAGYSG